MSVPAIKTRTHLAFKFHSMFLNVSHRSSIQRSRSDHHLLLKFSRYLPIFLIFNTFSYFLQYSQISQYSASVLYLETIYSNLIHFIPVSMDWDLTLGDILPFASSYLSSSRGDILKLVIHFLTSYQDDKTERFLDNKRQVNFLSKIHLHLSHSYSLYMGLASLFSAK